jgi:L-amino acid N-acyltransferase YncA
MVGIVPRTDSAGLVARSICAKDGAAQAAAERACRCCGCCGTGRLAFEDQAACPCLPAFLSASNPSHHQPDKNCPVEITVRPASPDDAEGIAWVLNAIIAAGIYTALDTPVTVDEERAFIERFPARGIFHVAVAGDRVVGFQNVEPFASYTHAFDHVGVIGTYVDLAHRRRGIATRLFEATYAAARAKGYEKLFAFVRADNPNALLIYARQRFSVIGTARRHAKIDERYIDELMIERILTDNHARRT